MKNLKDIISEKLNRTKSSFMLEKLKINSKSKVNNNFDPERLTDQRFTLYDSQSYENEDDEAIDWKDCEDSLMSYNDQAAGFIACDNPISKIKNFEKSIYHINDYLLSICVKIITGKDLGYEIRYEYGHLEIDCINSGSRATYYIYGLSEEAFDKIEQWWNDPDELEGDTDEEKLAFLFKEGNIIPIEDK